MIRLISFAAAAFLLASQAIASETLDLVQVEANEGNSSGGHVAILFGEEVFHFQHEQPGILRLQRDRWKGFRHQYSDLGNRGIDVLRVAAAPSEIAAVRDSFASLMLAQNKQLAVLAETEEDAALLTEVAEAPHRGLSRAIPGAGFFAIEAEWSHEPLAQPCESLRSLRKHARDAYGTDALERDRARLAAEARALRYTPSSAGVATRNSYPRSASFSRRFDEIAARLVALAVLEHAACLRGEATIAVDHPLTADERRALAQIQGALRDDLIELVGSPRPDKGLALLVGMARLSAIAESLREGRLIVLNAFPAPSDGDRTVTIDRRSLKDALSSRAMDELATARERFFATDSYREARLTALEAAATRHTALAASMRDGSALTVHGGTLIPSRATVWHNLPRPEIASEQARRDALAARRLATERRAQIVSLWGYDLLRRNCATEIFRQIRAVAPGLAPPARRNPFEFMPAMTKSAVATWFADADVSRVPSVHERYLRAQQRSHGRLRAALIESNSQTSQFYRDWSSREDSAFLFFARDPAVLRPLFGAINLATGVGVSAAGLMVAPFDDGDTAIAGLRGIVFSVPELFFIPIRKGSFEYVPLPDR